ASQGVPGVSRSDVGRDIEGFSLRFEAFDVASVIEPEFVTVLNIRGVRLGKDKGTGIIIAILHNKATATKDAYVRQESGTGALLIARCPNEVKPAQGGVHDRQNRNQRTSNN
ncbi:MAG: hypothetical protein NTU53_05550, partial [Planctomycetota bacterium]|nr:hypothetical protein [Planctomycetota bacterium]